MQGNDLVTPMPQYGFQGLVPGDRWCVCAPRWKEAFDAGFAPPVILEATHQYSLEFVTMDELRATPPNTDRPMTVSPTPTSSAVYYTGNYWNNRPEVVQYMQPPRHGRLRISHGGSTCGTGGAGRSGGPSR